MIKEPATSLEPVVVVDSTLNALGVVRSLAPGGMPIFMVTRSRFCAGAWTRHCRVVRFPNSRGRDFIDRLKVLGRDIGRRPVLILTTDVEVEAVSTYREELQPLFRFSLPSKEMVSTLADKTKFQVWAEQEGFPVPRAVVFTATSDMKLLQSLPLPVVIKPSDKGDAGQGERPVKAETVEQARSVSAHMLARAKALIIQEWIEGDDIDIYFTLFSCDSQGELICSFSGRKLVCHPPEVGMTAICVSARDVGIELEQITRDFIKRTRYSGLGSLEFKRHRQTGQFIIVEPTIGRTDWQEEIATLCGTNIPLTTYWSEVRREVQPTPGKPEPLAWRSSIVHRLPPGMAPPRTQVWDGYFRLTDPLPGVYYYVIDVFSRKLAKCLLPAAVIDFARKRL
jgi:predicted ATP-grasp superfamily ATP-dependent carboligase